MSSFRLELEKQPSSNDSIAVYKAKGKLSLETVSEFTPKMREEPARYLVLDLSAVNFLDSAGVGALVSLFVSRRNQGKVFALAALSPQSTAVVTVAGLQNLLSVYKTVEEALAKA
jgi:anti-sigma B factor antagonist